MSVNEFKTGFLTRAEKLGWRLENLKGEAGKPPPDPDRLDIEFIPSIMSDAPRIHVYIKETGYNVGREYSFPWEPPPVDDNQLSMMEFGEQFARKCHTAILRDGGNPTRVRGVIAPGVPS